MKNSKKTLKFLSHLVSSILKQERGITTRLFDEKNISEGDILDFIDKETNKKFATVRITKVYEKSFSETAKESADIDGMYEMYTHYYQRKISPNDIVKFIYYDFIKKY